MGVYLGGPYTDYSAMRGPCDNGFHVPTNDEWTNIVTIWTSLGGGSSAGTNFCATLKIPFAGQRPGNNGNTNAQGTLGRYWCCTCSSTDATRAYYNYLDASSISVGTNIKYGGFSIRAFKDSPVIPTNSWSKLYGTSIESGGIFWSSADGLISLSSDGATWLTISDKNLGATYAWNSGELLSQTNCGKYYQRGNNYGFPFTGSITTSSTQVNASTYGPGNYYSSSTFITRSSSPYNWDSSDNNNLRGGETGTVQVEQDLKNAYIGEYRVPGANTIAYYPLKSNFNDASGNGYNLTNNGATITTFNGVDCAYYSGSSSVYSENYSVPVGETRTINFWSYLPEERYDIVVFTGQGTYGRFGVGYYADNSGCVGRASDFQVLGLSGNRPIGGKWVNIVGVVEGYNMYLYTNGELDASGTRSVTSSSTTRLRIGGTGNTEWFKGYVNEVIFEDKARTAQEVANYYNLTKGNYGL